MLHQIEQKLRIRQAVISNFERLGVADHFSQFRQPHRLPPGKRAEPKHCTINCSQQQQIKIKIGDVGTLVGEHGTLLCHVPIAAIGRQHNGRSEGDRPADEAAHRTSASAAHAAFYRCRGAPDAMSDKDRSPGAAEARRQ